MEEDEYRGGEGEYRGGEAEYRDDEGEYRGRRDSSTNNTGLSPKIPIITRILGYYIHLLRIGIMEQIYSVRCYILAKNETTACFSLFLAPYPSRYWQWTGIPAIFYNTGVWHGVFIPEF